MPIGVPRIIYCWGEELPAQWTDIYNFIFRRRMVFLMQYLDDELCNQICGLLINIHMEDRSKELEKKELEKSGMFKSPAKQSSGGAASGAEGIQNKGMPSSSFEDLLAAEEDLGISEINTLEEYTLQKITKEWLNWNAQFFDYSDEPYLFYLAEMLSKDFNKGDANFLYSGNNKEMSVLMNMFKNMSSSDSTNSDALMQFFDKFSDNAQKNVFKNQLEVYSPFRLLSDFAAKDYDLKNLNPLAYNSSEGNDIYPKRELFELFNSALKNKATTRHDSIGMSKLLSELGQKDFSQKTYNPDTLSKSSEKALSQRILRKEYTKDKTFNPTSLSENYLDFYSYNDSFNDFKNSQKKQAERAFQEEESKKVFLIINSFGGSVGNGITVHDALQFIKAGSLTLALGVAASAASLALAGGTIGERYVTEGCHVMIHQPEGGIKGQASDIWIDSQEIMKIRLDVAEIYSLATYRPRHKILRDLDRDFYLTATETIHYGLADEIATNEVMHEIIEMTSKVWDYHDTTQQRLLESRDTSASGLDTQSQN